MSTLDAVIDSVLNDYLLAGQREARNVLATTVNSSATSVVLTYSLRGAQEGAKVALEYEDMYVVGSDTGTKTLTVIRGQFGTTAAAHTNGAVAWVNPKWSRAQVLRAVNGALDSLSGKGLFQMASKELTFSAPVSGYDLDGVTPDDLIDIYEVRTSAPGPQKSWRPIDHFSLVRDADTTDFPSGLGLVLYEPGHPGFPLRVTYRKRFTQVTSTQGGTDLATSAGIDREAHDLIALEAAISLALGKEIQRNQLDASPDGRRAEEVPPGASLAAVNGLVKKRDERLKEEKARLARRYPIRKPVAA